MALLDVSSVLFDPDFIDNFEVVRRVETIDVHGRSSITEQRSRQIGVVTAISPSDLDRREDYQAMTRSISVVTQYKLRGEITGQQPDIIVWRGDNFVVKHIDPYPQFGKGFVQVECTSMDRTDGPLEAPAPISTAFNLAVNSSLVSLLG